jgi:two-component system chemotaxis sensor kinase CheA
LSVAGDPYKYFRVEARDLLEQLGCGVVELERGGAGQSGTVSRLLRLAHTLKGAARVVKQPEIAEAAHQVEDLLEPFRDGLAFPIPREGLEKMLGLVDAMAGRVRSLAPPPGEAASSAEEAFRTLRTEVAEMDGLLGGIAEAQARLGAVARGVGSLDPVLRLAAVVAETSAVAGRSGTGTETPAESLRTRLGDLEREMAAATEGLERELRQVRIAGERLRLLPVSALSSPLERTVSDVARSLGKRATFRLEGGDIRLDGDVLGTLQTGLLQVVRNAVAHGIEVEAARVAAGKSSEGLVVLEVERRDGRVAFRCRDDGGGIDLGAVRRGLQRQGRSSGEAARIGDDEVLSLLLEGGLSTAPVVTDVSGRGVGLDVVRAAAARLGASVSIRTRPAQGTTVEIVVPVSLSSVEALWVEAAGIKAAIPLGAVVRARRLGRGDVDGSTERDLLQDEGRLLPFAHLAGLLHQGSESSVPAVRSAVVVAGTRGQVAVGVERLLEIASVLVRGLPGLAPIDPIVAGVAIDPEGNPQPVLDPERMVDAALRAERPTLRPRTPNAPILVVDDSLTTRMLEQSILESAGYEVHVATSGEEALTKARRQKYGLLLVDVEMPGMSGFELLEALQSDAALQHLPAILVTSRDSPEDRVRGTRAGAKAYVVKSDFDQVDLLRRIGSLMS